LAGTSREGDRDYDALADKTDLAFGSVWLAPAGAL
jgi:hypothetical protein